MNRVRAATNGGPGGTGPVLPRGRRLPLPGQLTPTFPHDPRPFEQRTVPTWDGERPYDAQPFWISTPRCRGYPPSRRRSDEPRMDCRSGMQIIGPRYEDDTAITFAELTADVVGRYEPPPV